MRATAAANEKPSEAYQQTMKDVGAANAKLRADVTQIEKDGSYPDWTLIDGDVAKLRASFTVALEFWQTMVGLSGESQNFDGNGQMTRFTTGGGPHLVSTGSVGGAFNSQQFGNAIVEPIGTRPKRPARVPPYNRTFPCYKNPLPNINDAVTGGGP